MRTSCLRVAPPRRFIRAAAFASALSGLAACRGDSGDGASSDRVVELTDTRLFEADDSLNGVRGIAVGPRSELWVIGAAAPFVHHFDSSGRLIASFGRAGQGPGELATPHDVFAPTVADSVVRVWSPGRAVITTFERSGAPSGSAKRVALTQPSIMLWTDKLDYIRVRPMARWGTGFLVQDVRRPARGVGGVRDIADAGLLILDSMGVVLDTLLEFRTLTGATRPAPSVMYLTAVPVWTVCPNGTAAVVDPYGMRVLRYAVDGQVVRTDTLPVDASPVTDDDIRRWLRNWPKVEEYVAAIGGTLPDSLVNRVTRELLTTRRSELGTTAPPAVRVACDEDGHLWLQRYNTADEPRGLGREWIVVSDGRIVRRYRFPQRFQPMAFTRGFAYGIQKDSLDTERVASVRIPDERRDITPP